MSQTGVYPTAPAFTPGDTLHVSGTGATTGASPAVDPAVGDLLVTKAYELAVYGVLRPNLIFDQFATVRATRQTHRGSSVQFNFINDLALSTTPLNENQDVDSAVLTTDTVTVALAEYGNAVSQTAMLRGTSMVPFDPVAAERVGWNAAQSTDVITRQALEASTNTVGTGVETLSSDILRAAVQQMKSANVVPFQGGNYVAVISPKMEADLKAEADAAGWRWVVGQYPGGGNSIYNGEVGLYEGVRMIVNNNLADDGQGFIMGQEALAKAFSSAAGFGPNPRVIVAPVVDKLRRFASVGWHHLVGYSIFRDEALIKLDLAAS